MTVTDEQKDLKKELIDYKKALEGAESNQDRFNLLINIGRLHKWLDQYPESYKAYSQALRYAETEEQNHEVRMAIGHIYVLLEKYDKGLKSFKLSLRYAKTEEENCIALINIGYAYLKLEQYKLALKSLLKANLCVDELEDLNDYKWAILFNTASAYRSLKDFDKALIWLKKAFGCTNNKNRRYRSKLYIAYCYSDMKRCKSSLYAYYRALRYASTDEQKAEALLNIASSWQHLKRYDDALDKFKEALSKAKTPYQRYICHVNIGILLMGREGKLTKDGEAINQFDSALKCATLKERSWLLNKVGTIYFSDKQFNVAFGYFEKRNVSIDLRNLLATTVDKSIVFDKDLIPIIELDENYKNTVGKITGSKLLRCAEFYFITCKIAALLSVKSDFETKIAHYTSISKAGFLLDPKGAFRLSSISQVNDPSEGKSLLSYFKKTSWEEITPVETKQQAFISCFSFNHNHLNQFRLYGKDNNQEATGLSLVIERDKFFNQDEITTSFAIAKPDSPIIAAFDKENLATKKELTGNNQEALSPEKYHLFRCIYIDPLPLASAGAKTIFITLAQRDKHTFAYNQESNSYADYADELTQKTEKVFDKLKELKSIYDEYSKNENENENILEALEQLSLQLKYLVKDIAFKEEQECRCFDLKAINDERVKNDAARAPFPNTSYFIENTSIVQAVSKIWLGPESNELPAIKEFLAHHELSKIKVEKSKLPIRNKK